MSTVVKLGPHWPFFAGVKFLFIFGDSYSSVDYYLEQDCPPDAIQPLGVAYPGYTWSEENKPNWVGYLISDYYPAPRYIPGRDEKDQDPAYMSSPLLVYNYARGGDTIIGVKQQTRSWFLSKAGEKPKWCPWSANTSLFVTWIGINDCAYNGDHSQSMKDLLVLHGELYEAGARNFLFVDVPPMDRSPALPLDYFSKRENCYDMWNAALRKAVETFASSHEDVTVLLYSSHATFTKILDNPEEYGFNAGDVRRREGSVWADHLHPTSKVHRIVAQDVAGFLSAVGVN
ncbi:hypothetical protein APHAL10511_001118 [Amanita phalloides]|nr:hypothetical protein APHAL10511_001118 [Amanita phalloides]